MVSKNKLVPHLWFNKEAREAAEYYASLFRNSEVTNITTISGTPSGEVDIVGFKIWDVEFTAISAGPLFKINPSISFFVYCGSGNEIDRLYKSLSENGTVLMPLDKYPWSSKYAWVQDKFGVSWQLDIDDINSGQKIVPAILFVNEKAGKLKEAVEHYTTIFPDSKIMMESPWDKSSGLPEGSLLFTQFKLNGYIFNAMSGGTPKHEFDFNEAVSFMAYCNDQQEIDYYWEKLSAGGTEQPCGWVKDKFGVSWQVVPVEMMTMMHTENKERLERLTKSMLKMGKLDREELISAFYGK
ncbi:MAG TPA: VOC family protein [Melioribacteraceae bacterium]|nr:VOC family protein [Melioribacteraceae bacterium]